MFLFTYKISGIRRFRSLGLAHGALIICPGFGFTNTSIRRVCVPSICIWNHHKINLTAVDGNIYPIKYLDKYYTKVERKYQVDQTLIIPWAVDKINDLNLNTYNNVDIIFLMVFTALTHLSLIYLKNPWFGSLNTK